MTQRLLSTVCLLAWCIVLFAGPTEVGDADRAALDSIDALIAQAQAAGDVAKEGDARWQRIIALKNSSLTDQIAPETDRQMDWFRRHDQWDAYYRAWQLKANVLSMQGQLQLALQETQRMLDDANDHDNRLGRAMAYKQIGVIYLNMKQTAQAIDALQRYAELIKDDGDTGAMSNVYYRIAKAYDYDGDYRQELGVTRRWLSFIRSNDHGGEMADFMGYYNACHLARTAAYIGLHRLDSARQALDSAAYYVHRNNTKLSLHHYYKMAARYAMACGDAASTLLYTDSIRLITKEKDDHADELRAQALMLQGNGIEAARIYQRLYHEKDSVFGRDARQHLDELNTLFQVDELKTEQQRTKMRYTQIAAASIVLALLLLLLYGWRTAIRQKRANEQLRIANERATVSSKMKSEFIRNISHEIRTPLNIVSGFTQILTTPDMELPSDELADIQERVTENTDRITKLVDRMLELSDASSEAFIERNDRIDMSALVAQAVQRSRIALHTRPDNPEAKVSFEYIQEETAEPVILRTNELYAVRTLSQLLENAVKFTREGSIVLTTSCTDEIARFTVVDTGIGIPEEHTEHIFDEFVQLDEFADGTGIGLTVARSLARRMGGDLWLDTDYSQGARFVLELPRK